MRRFRSIVTTTSLWIGCCLIPGVLSVHSVVAQEAAPKQYDNAAARQYLVQAEQAAAKVTDKKLHIEALEEIAMDKARAGDYEGARVIARVLGTDESKAKIIQAIAVAQVLADDMEEGMKSVGGIRSAARKTDACCAIAAALVDAGRKPEAVFVLRESLDHTAKIPDEEAVMALLSVGIGFARAGEPTITSKFAAEMKGEPLVVELGAALYTIAKAWNSDVQGAKAKLALVHNDMLRLAALAVMLEVQYKAGDKPGAVAAGQEMVRIMQKSSSPPTMILGVASFQNEYGDSPTARETIALVLEPALKKEDGPTLDEIASRQALMGDVDAALKTLALIKKPEDQCYARQAIANARAKAGDVPGSLAMAPADADAYCQAEVLIGTARGILDSLKKPVKK